MKTKTQLALAFSLAFAGLVGGCGDDPGSRVDGGDNLGGMGGTGAVGGSGGGMPGTGGTGGMGMTPDGGVPDGGDADLTFGAFVIDLIKNRTNETESPTSLEGRTFNMTEDVTTFVELLK